MCVLGLCSRRTCWGPCWGPGRGRACPRRRGTRAARTRRGGELTALHACGVVRGASAEAAVTELRLLCVHRNVIHPCMCVSGLSHIDDTYMYEHTCTGSECSQVVWCLPVTCRPFAWLFRALLPGAEHARGPGVCHVCGGMPGPAPTQGGWLKVLHALQRQGNTSAHPFYYCIRRRT